MEMEFDWNSLIALAFPTILIGIASCFAIYRQSFTPVVPEPSKASEAVQDKKRAVGDSTDTSAIDKADPVRKNSRALLKGDQSLSVLCLRNRAASTVMRQVTLSPNGVVFYPGPYKMLQYALKLLKSSGTLVGMLTYGPQDAPNTGVFLNNVIAQVRSGIKFENVEEDFQQEPGNPIRLCWKYVADAGEVKQVILYVNEDFPAFLPPELREVTCIYAPHKTLPFWWREFIDALESVCKDDCVYISDIQSATNPDFNKYLKLIKQVLKKRQTDTLISKIKENYVPYLKSDPTNPLARWVLQDVITAYNTLDHDDQKFADMDIDDVSLRTLLEDRSSLYAYALLKDWSLRSETYAGVLHRFLNTESITSYNIMDKHLPASKDLDRVLSWCKRTHNSEELMRFMQLSPDAVPTKKNSFVNSPRWGSANLKDLNLPSIIE